MGSYVTSFQFELLHGHPRVRVAGVDEVGRGCLAGPVVAGAVVLPTAISDADKTWLARVTDSKLLSPAAREEFFPRIQALARSWAIGMATVEEIDAMNILRATQLAMVRALAGLFNDEAGEPVRGVMLRGGECAYPDVALIDGNQPPRGLKLRTVPIVKGDQQSVSIACASILAKVWRDDLMKQLAEQHPGYGLEIHKGYFTPQHKEALARLGPCALHRRSFAPVRAALGASV